MRDISDKQLYCQWFDEHGNGPQYVPVEGGGIVATPIHIEWRVACLGANVSICGPSFGGFTFSPDDARQLAVRLQEAADIADGRAIQLTPEGEELPPLKTFDRGVVGGKTFLMPGEKRSEKSEDEDE